MTCGTAQNMRQEISIPSLKTEIIGDLSVPNNPRGVIIFAHGIGSSRKSERNRHVADVLHRCRFATLLIDLHSEQEAEMERVSHKLRGDFVPHMAGRINAATEWVLNDNRTSNRPVGYFGASAGAAAVLAASLQRPQIIGAIVCRGGRPDLVDRILPDIRPPILLIVGDKDTSTLQLNQASMKKLKTEKQLVTIPDASHLFEEPGKLDEVAAHAANWFQEHLITVSE